MERYAMKRGTAVLVSFLFITALLVENASGANWQNWRGPNRDGVTSEASGYALGAWPLGMPIWKTGLNATGESSPIVYGGRIYAMGYRDGKDYIYCLNLQTGDILWTQSYPSPPRGRFAHSNLDSYAEGPSSTPEYDEQTGYLYTYSIDGYLNCWNTRKNGEKVWGANLSDIFHVQVRPDTGNVQNDYGCTTSPYVYGPWVIVEVGCKEGSLLAFDKLNGGNPPGTAVWRSQVDDPAGHTGGPVPMTVDGVPCLAVLTLYHLAIVRLDKGYVGRTYALFDYKATDDANLVSPAVWKNYAFLSTHLGPGNDLVEITSKGAVKCQSGPHSEVGVPIFYNGMLYHTSGWLECWEMNSHTAKMLWRSDNFGVEGTGILTGDGKLIMQGNSKIELIDAVTGKTLARTDGEPVRWISPALSDGVLVCKNDRGELWAYSLRRKQ